MATAILGLGILGLLALFAGTARQQQIASEATDSLLITANAQSIIGPEVGSLEDPFGPGFTGSRPLDNLVPNVWYPMTAEGVNTTSGSSARAYHRDSDEIFFLADANVPGDQFALYEGGTENWSLGPSSGNCNGSFMMQFDQGEFLRVPGRPPRAVLAAFDRCRDRRLRLRHGRGEPSRRGRIPLAFFGTGSDYDASNNIAYYLGPDHAGAPGDSACPGPVASRDARPTPSRRAARPMTSSPSTSRTRTRATTRATSTAMNIRSSGPRFANPPTYRVQSITVQTPFRFRRTGIVGLDSRLNYRGTTRVSASPSSVTPSSFVAPAVGAPRSWSRPTGSSRPSPARSMSRRRTSPASSAGGSRAGATPGSAPTGAERGTRLR